jgi:hypothetical protein
MHHTHMLKDTSKNLQLLYVTALASKLQCFKLVAKCGSHEGLRLIRGRRNRAPHPVRRPRSASK